MGYLIAKVFVLGQSTALGPLIGHDQRPSYAPACFVGPSLGPLLGPYLGPLWVFLLGPFPHGSFVT